MAGHSDINRTAHYYKMTSKSKLNAIKKLSLSEVDLPLFERAKEFRDLFFKELGRLAKSPEEEQFLLRTLGLTKLPS